MRFLIRRSMFFFRRLKPCLLLSFFFFTHVALSQTPRPPPPSAPSQSSFGLMVSILIPMLFTFIFILGFLAVCLRILRKQNPSTDFEATAVVRDDPYEFRPGLDASVVDGFSTFLFAERKVKDCRDCSVCLNEFDDGDTLRLITPCGHVFHADCIDKWFANHVTCPVCRANLEASRDGAPNQDQVAIRIHRDSQASSQHNRASPVFMQFRRLVLSRCRTTDQSAVTTGESSENTNQMEMPGPTSQQPL